MASNLFYGMGGNNFPSLTSTIFQHSASISGSVMMLSTAYTYVPHPVRAHIQSLYQHTVDLFVKWFLSLWFVNWLVSRFRTVAPDIPNILTVAINEYQGVVGIQNQVFEAADAYLNTKISPTTMKGLELSKLDKDKRVNISVNKRCQTIEDDFEGIQFKWRLVGTSGIKIAGANQYSGMRGMPGHTPTPHTDDSPTRFEVSFEEKHYGKVVEFYIPHILKRAKEMKDEKKTLNIYSGAGGRSDYGGGGGRGGVSLQHPSTFKTLAMDHELKKEIIDDLDRFVSRRDYYTRVGKAWKRGYLLYGPPGTGKSSLVAAMANYLNFDVYDLELTNVYSNAELRSVLLGTKNRSILLIEDIDCSAELQDRNDPYGRPKSRNNALTLSGLLNVIDGIWSCCGDERIIIFTTNHKDKLDPALLRPGRMDKHIHMSYITPQGFRILASNYLSIDNHHLFGEIEELILESQTTPAEVAEELMVSDDADVSLNGLVQFLKRKILEAEQLKEEEEAQKALKEEEEAQEPKRTESSFTDSNCGWMQQPPGVLPQGPTQYPAPMLYPPQFITPGPRPMGIHTLPAPIINYP
ncbi:hypothetical protein MKW94_010313 [Papaver nudicaule]|uniref:AAA+ ATPase domain-containing protein n=1 Tax=Papaver nudicaule TaxID=74823 RepID=A0AA41W301_PAPNU|nr:hypothetical protein [Papaver nudicaule]